MEEFILMQENSSGKVKYLRLILDGSIVTKKYGIIGGKEQERAAVYKPKNVGKSNEKTAEVVAKEALIRDLTKKKREGYLETDSMSNTPVFKDPFDFDLDNIPSSFCCSKPIKEITEAEIDKVILSGSAKFFVKYNGGCHYIHTNSKNEVKVYTRRLIDHTEKYPSIVKAVQGVYPPNTLIIVELCIDPLLNLDHMTAFKLFSAISKTDTHNGELKPSQEASIALQEVHPVRAAVFGYMYFNGGQLHHLSYDEQLVYIARDTSQLSAGNKLFMPQEVKEVESGESIISLAKTFKQKLEGFILWDTTKAMEVSMSGKPKRRACWKIKIMSETDVIAYEGLEGKTPGHYGSICVGKYDSNGELVPLGAVAGLKPNEGQTDPSWWDFPCVVEVEYTNVFPETGLFQHGTFVKVHEDKQITEVDLFTLVQ